MEFVSQAERQVRADNHQAGYLDEIEIHQQQFVIEAELKRW